LLVGRAEETAIPFISNDLMAQAEHVNGSSDFVDDICWLRMRAVEDNW